MKVPSYLIHEHIDNQPIFYRDYKAVLKKEKTTTEITGSSYLQSLVITYLLGFLLAKLSKKEYIVLTNEIGLHLSKGNNLSGDIAIYEKERLQGVKTDNYLEIPPKVVIEVDIKADESSLGNTFNYFHLKTQKLLSFGVEKVIWVSTSAKTITIAAPSTAWSTITWNDEFEVLPNLAVTLQELLEELE